MSAEFAIQLVSNLNHRLLALDSSQVDAIAALTEMRDALIETMQLMGHSIQ